jgi:predicted transcriptional regulator
MPKKGLPIPTDAELAILAVLWQRGPSTVREVHEELKRSEPVRYTTTLKQMQIMFEKGLVARDESQRAHVYRPTIAEEGTLRQVTADLLDRAFGGSAEKLVMHALQARRASPEELENIRKLIDKIRERRR